MNGTTYHNVPIPKSLKQTDYRHVYVYTYDLSQIIGIYLCLHVNMYICMYVCNAFEFKDFIIFSKILFIFSIPHSFCHLLNYDNNTH